MEAEKIIEFLSKYKDGEKVTLYIHGYGEFKISDIEEVVNLENNEKGISIVSWEMD